MKENSCACYGSNYLHECYCNLNNNNMKTQTAVEWLYETLWKQTDFSLPNNILEQAKAIEKEQLIDAYNNGQQIPPFEYAEQYYNKTFKKD